MIKEAILSKLNRMFTPLHLEVINESSMHKVPKGSETHFLVSVVSKAFEGKTLLARHKLVNFTLRQELGRGGLYALSIHTYTPSEWLGRDEAPRVQPICRGNTLG